MKNTITAFMLSSLFVLGACNKNKKSEITTITEVQQPEKFALDSVKVSDSVKINDSLSVKYSSGLLVFPGIKDKKLLDSIYFENKGIVDYSKEGLQNFLQKEKNDYFSSVKQDSKEWISDISFAQTWVSDFSMKMKSNENDYLHIQYLSSSYEGGAHGNYGFSERVFDLKSNRKVMLKDITSMPDKKLETLLMKNINKINSGTTDQDGAVNNSEMLLVDVIPVTKNFYFDNKNLYFHYSPYEIAAFAAGDIVIPISFEELNGTFNPNFKERMKIK